MYIQQGDVLLFKEEIPANAEAIKMHGADIKRGTATGHSHTLSGQHYSFYSVGNTKYLKIDQETPLLHQEHKEILLPVGSYRIGAVMEYDHFKEEAAEVQD